jgi:uncharacterized protein YjbJ (UPF0337 family)
MNKDILKGKWMQIRGDVKKTWGKLTDDDLAQVDGNRDKLVGVLVEKYGYSHEKAEQEVNRFDRDMTTRFGNETDTHTTHSH